MPITSSPFVYTDQMRNDVNRGFSALTSALAPASASDSAAFARAGLDTQKRDIIDKLRSDPHYQGPDAGVLADLFDPTSSFYAQDQNTAADLAKNANTVRGSAISSLFGALNQGQVRPAVPDNVAATIGLPGISQVNGAPKPLSEDEVKGAILRGMTPSTLPTLTNDQTVALTMGSTPVENVKTSDGPRTVYRTDAVGQEPAYPPPSTVINNGGESAYDKTYNENLAKGAIALQDDAQAARGTLNTVSEMRNLMADQNFYSGPAAQQIQVAKQIAATLGLTVSDTAAPMEAFNALSNQLIKDSIGGSLGNQISDADRQFVARTQANLGNTREGNEALLNVAEKLAQRKIETAQWADEYASQHNGRLDAGWNAFLDAKAKANPLFPSSEPGTAPAGQFTEGQTAINKATGQRLVYRGGQWTAVQ